MELFVGFVPFALKLLFCSGIYGVLRAKSAKNNTIQKNMIKLYYITLLIHCQEVYAYTLNEILRNIYTA